MIHYKLHTADGAAWCGKFIEFDIVDEKGISRGERATDKGPSVTCPKCNKAILLFVKQVGEAQRDRNDENYFPCRK